MNSFDINHIFNNNNNFGQWPKCNTIPDSAMLQLSCEFDESKWNTWVNMLTSSSGTNCVLNEHEDVGQYGSYVIPGYGDARLQLSFKFG